MKLYSDEYIDKIVEIIVTECDDETLDRIRDRFKELDEAGGASLCHTRVCHLAV